MKTFAIISLFFLATASSFSVKAQKHSISGKVEKLVSIHNDATANPAGATKVYLGTTESAGTCPKDTAGRVILWLRTEDRSSDGSIVNDRLFSMLLTAYVADNELTVTVNDDLTVQGGACFLQLVQFGS